MKKSFLFILLLVVFSFQLNAQNPGGVSGAQLWLDADDLDADANSSNNPANGADVSLWKDKSGNGHDCNLAGVVGATFNLPSYELNSFNGKASVRFDKSNTEALGYLLPSTYLGDFTVFMVLEGISSAPQNFESFFSSWNSTDVSSFQIDFNSSSNAFQVRTQQSLNVEFQTANTELQLYTVITDNLTLKTYSDGVLQNTGTLTSPIGFNAYRLGVNRNSSSFYDSKIAEVIIFHRKLTDCEIENVNNYLGTKYGKDFNNIASNFGFSGAFGKEITGIGAYNSLCSGLVTVNEAISSAIKINNPSSNNVANEFLTIAHNGLALDTLKANVPAGYSKRIKRIWKVDKDGDVGTVDITFDLSKIGLSSTAVPNQLALLLDVGGFYDDFTNATAINNGVINFSNKTITFSNVSLVHGHEISLVNDQVYDLTETISACGSYTWRDGVNYTASNSTAIHMVPGAAAGGCDSVYHLNLTIHPIANLTETRTACGSYTWRNGTTYNASNSTATHTVPGVAAGGCDSIYHLNLTIHPIANLTEIRTACGSYTWRDGVTYTANNTTATHTVTGVAANGCDSIYHLNLTIHPIANLTENRTACVSYTWRDGVTYTASNATATHTVTGVAANGCDSVYHLNLTIHPIANFTETRTACGSYTWRDGVTYTASNTTATHTVAGVAAGGCDSVYHLNLTITPTNTAGVASSTPSLCINTSLTAITHSTTGATGIGPAFGLPNGVSASWSAQVITISGTPSESGSFTYYVPLWGGCGVVNATGTITVNPIANLTETRSACGSYTWRDGVNYTASNSTATHTVTGVAANGCDSIYHLNLTINPIANLTETRTACGSYTWRDGVTYTANNTTAIHTVTGVAANGCDSVYHLNLTIHPIANFTETRTACGSYTWRDGVTYTASNTTAIHTVTGVAANGCDSIYHLNLTIHPIANLTEIRTACGSYTWRDGVTYTANNTTATHTVTGVAANGCDSVYHLNLTINSAVDFTETKTACGSYTWRNGVTYTSNNTTATFTVLGAAGGCDSVYHLNLTIKTVNTNFQLVGFNLVADASTGTFQWIDCNTGIAIPGATNATFALTTPGVYGLVVSAPNGCVDTSACYYFNTAGMEETYLSAISIYPNPTNGELTIVSGSYQGEVVLKNALGQIIAVFELSSTKMTYTLPNEKGIYFMEFKDEKKPVVKRIVRQ